MKIIHIDEECHGHIGTAKTYEDALKYLIEAKWITLNYEFWNKKTEDWESFYNILNYPKDIKQTEEIEIEMFMYLNEFDKNDDIWDGSFYFYEDELIEY